MSASRARQHRDFGPGVQAGTNAGGRITGVQGVKAPLCITELGG
jgi:hypothetical protein